MAGKVTKAGSERIRDLHHSYRARELNLGFQTDAQGVHCIDNDVAKVSEKHE